MGFELFRPSWAGDQFGKFALRNPNNFSESFRDQCNGLANTVGKTYGGGYEESVQYLRALARNEFYLNARLPNLVWHSLPGQQLGAMDPQYTLHPAVVAALAPGMPLRAMFGGARDV